MAKGEGNHNLIGPRDWWSQECCPQSVALISDLNDVLKALLEIMPSMCLELDGFTALARMQ